MSEFVTYLHEVFSQFGEITTRKMFGGHGVFHQGLMFGLVANDELYLKADAATSGQFEKLELAAFEYEKNNKAVKMSYHRAPESIFDDPDKAQYWANLAFEAAMRATSNAKKIQKPGKRNSLKRS